MAKKILLAIGALCSVCLITVGAVFLHAHLFSQKEMYANAERLESTLGEDWTKSTATEVFRREYSNAEGNKIVYYLCQTTYYSEAPATIVNLNTEAISTIIDPQAAETTRECTVNDYPAVILYKDGLSYLCWTMSPETSCILKYDPTVLDETTMFRMAESVPAPA